MISRARFSWLGAVLASASVLLACASQTVSEATLEEEEAGADSAGALDTGPVATDASTDAASCSASKLCVTPLPVDDSVRLTSIWGSRATNVWAVGSRGTVLHYDGVAWEAAVPVARVEGGAPDFTLQSVWLEPDDDVWIADSRYLRRTSEWKGPSATEWSFTLASSDCFPVAIRGAGGTVWVIVRDFVAFLTCPITRFDADGGRSNVARTGEAPISLAVTRPDEAWVSTSDRVSPHMVRNRVLRLRPPPNGQGATWELEEFDPATMAALRGAWGDEAVVWFAGERGTLRRVTRNDVANKKLEGVPSPVTTDLYGIFGFGTDDVWAVGDASTVVHWDGTKWTALSTPFDDMPHKPRFSAVWGSSPADVWIVGDGAALHYQENVP